MNVVSEKSMSALREMEARDGTPTFSRAAHLLRVLAQRGSAGYRLAELSIAADIPHPTVHRLLKCLIKERFATQDKQTRRYSLGPLVYELGLAASYHAGGRERYRPMIENLADVTGELIYLTVRSGSDVCLLDRMGGSPTIRSRTLQIGGRRPIIKSAGGRAIMARMPDTEVEVILNEADRECRIERACIERALEKTRVHGYAITRNGTIPGVSAVGVAVPNRSERPVYGVGIVMESERLDLRRMRELHGLVQSEMLRFQGAEGLN